MSYKPESSLGLNAVIINLCRIIETAVPFCICSDLIGVDNESFCCLGIFAFRYIAIRSHLAMSVSLGLISVYEMCDEITEVEI